MEKRNWAAKIFLLPLSKLYGVVTAVRNFLFDIKLLKEMSFSVPIVVVGNLAVGGTGKTPHVEYIVSHLQRNYHLAILSRGYKRSTRGFVMATQRSTPADIGDEPFQMYQKFDGNVPVAVCEDRVAGINELLAIDPAINLVILDDAFQHRSVKPTLAILLTDYSHPLFEDKMLPYGTLRESKSGLKRADIIISTKTPARVSALDMHIFEENLKMQPWQKLYFSRLNYCSLMPVFPDQAPPVAPALDWLTSSDMLLAISGIGNPRPFVRFIKRFKAKVRVNTFPDHHNFTRKDMQLIQQRFETMKGLRNFIITTEKDAVRISASPYFPHQLKPYIYYLPITVDIMRGEGDAFIAEITKAVNKHLK